MNLGLDCFIFELKEGRKIQGGGDKGKTNGGVEVEPRGWQRGLTI